MTEPCDKALFGGLDRALTAFGIADAAEREKIIPWCRSRSFSAGDMLHRAGEVADRIYFINAGMVRLYYATPDGKEHNKSFAREHQFVGALQSTDAPLPSRFDIQALEPCQVVSMALAGLSRLYQESLPWANLGRLYMEQLAVRKTRREAAFLLDSAEQRYRDFLQEQPELMERLPLYHIASYLGITDVALSRIRRRVENAAS